MPLFFRWRRNRSLLSLKFGCRVLGFLEPISMPDRCRWLRSVGPQRALLQGVMLAFLYEAAPPAGWALQRSRSEPQSCTWQRGGWIESET
jgi:hypothetical protein